MADRHAEIKESYKQLGGSFASLYDGMITYTKPLGKLMNRAIWGFNEQTTQQWINGALSGIPDGFSGRILEVPIGTGVITMPMYRKLPDADITCLDYSPDMMKNAQKRAEAMGISNITFQQGDAGALPFPDESFDIVLSLNGFHAFPDKEAAYRETFRVLKHGGTFCGCFYVQGGCKRTDWFIRHLYQPKGFFTPSYETEQSLRRRLSGLYKEAEVTMVEGMGCFCCRK